MKENITKQRQADRLLFLLMLVPTITELMETGSFPVTLRDTISDVVLTIAIGILVFLFLREHRKLEYLSETDELTKLKNRRAFERDFDSAVTMSHRLGSTLTLAIIDIDDFKLINDRYGHKTGDRVLRDAAELIKNSVRHEVDVCYRAGGDEFAILLPAVGKRGSEGIERRLKMLKEKGDNFLGQYNSSLSIGTAALRDADSPDDLFRRADKNMYREKRVNGTGSKETIPER
jgi:diguanylate cyclase (GGDEF)-like protein